MNIYEEKFLTNKNLIEINRSTSIKFTPFIVVNKLFKKNCEKINNEKYSQKVYEIRKKFKKVYRCISSFLTISDKYKNTSICNMMFQNVEDEIIKSFNKPDDVCECCKYYAYKKTYSNSKEFYIYFSHSGYKFFLVYHLKLPFYELITYLISIPTILLGINFFKLIKIIWIKFLT